MRLTAIVSTILALGAMASAVPMPVDASLAVRQPLIANDDEADIAIDFEHLSTVAGAEMGCDWEDR